MAESTLAGGPSTDAMASTVATSMPRLKHDLARLIGIPSVSAPNYPAETHGPLLEAYAEVVALFRDAGAQILDPLELPDTAPVVLGEIPRPRARRRCALQPLQRRADRRGVEVAVSRRSSATERDGAISGRGSADTKSNILITSGALRASNRKTSRFGIKIVIEGQEEVGGAFSTFPPSRPGLFEADADGDRRHG